MGHTRKERADHHEGTCLKIDHGVAEIEQRQGVCHVEQKLGKNDHGDHLPGLGVAANEVSAQSCDKTEDEPGQHPDHAGKAQSVGHLLHEGTAKHHDQRVNGTHEKGAKQRGKRGPGKLRRHQAQNHKNGQQHGVQGNAINFCACENRILHQKIPPLSTHMAEKRGGCRHSTVLIRPYEAGCKA